MILLCICVLGLSLFVMWDGFRLNQLEKRCAVLESRLAANITATNVLAVADREHGKSLDIKVDDTNYQAGLRAAREAAERAADVFKRVGEGRIVGVNPPPDPARTPSPPPPPPPPLKERPGEKRSGGIPMAEGWVTFPPSKQLLDTVDNAVQRHMAANFPGYFDRWFPPFFENWRREAILRGKIRE